MKFKRAFVRRIVDNSTSTLCYLLRMRNAPRKALRQKIFKLL